MKTKKEKSVKKEAVEKTSSEQKDIEENKGVAILSYLALLFIVPLLVRPESKFVKFHVKQGIVLTIGWVVGGILYPFMGLGFLVHVAIMVFSIMGIVNVSEGKMKDLPIIGDLAKKFNF